MPKIFIQNMAKTLEATDTSRALLFHIQQEYLDWMHACGGKGRCTTCKAKILIGTENLSELTKAEHYYLDRGELLSDERLACQVKVTGDIVIAVPEETKLPHFRYVD